MSDDYFDSYLCFSESSEINVASWGASPFRVIDLGLNDVIDAMEVRRGTLTVRSGGIWHIVPHSVFQSPHSCIEQQ